MRRANLRKAFSLLIITALLLGAFSSLALAQETPTTETPATTPAAETPAAEAPAAETPAAEVPTTAVTATVPAGPVSSAALAGTLTGGVFDKTWLGLTPSERDIQVTLVADWNRDDPSGNGLTFYVLTAANVASVQAGGSLQQNNIAAGGAYAQGAGNQQIAQFKASDSAYTVVVANDSAQDAAFTLRATNALLNDDAGRTTDPDAPAAAATTESAPAAEAVAAPAVVTVTAAATTTAATTATAPVTTAAAVTAAPAAAPGAPVVVTAAELDGTLPGDGVQHYLGLTPNERDGNITLNLRFDPQDSQELARRMNFWVLDDSGFQRYVDGTAASEVAVAAGSRAFTGPANERVATFNATGFGPYTVIVYNNSLVPATYNLAATGGLLVDDGGQTDTAKAAGATAPVAATGASTATTTAASTAPATASTATTGTTTAAATTATRTGEPGGTYTVKAGDTMALIARDIYGDYTLYEEICAYNNIPDCARIEIGDVIQLPTQAQIDANATAPAAAATPAAAAATPAAAATTAVTDTMATTATETMTGTTPATSTTPVTRTTGTTAGLPTSTAVAPSGTAAATPATTPAATTGSAETIVEVAEANGNFTTLVKALTAAGLDDDLAGAGPFTVFAPTDAAFNALGAATVDALLKDTRKLQQILLFHVVDDEITSENVTNGMEVVTMQGSPVGFTLTGATAKVQDSNIVVPDVEASNGFIHVIDKVMLPPVP